MKFLALDYGTRRIGVAVTDDNAIHIRGLPTISRKDEFRSLTNLEACIRRENPDRIIFGLPLRSDDSESSMSRDVRRFAKMLCDRVSLPCSFIDESFSSKRAQRMLRYRKKKIRRDKAAVDRIAACLILEEYLRERGEQHEIM